MLCFPPTPLPFSSWSLSFSLSRSQFVLIGLAAAGFCLLGHPSAASHSDRDSEALSIHSPAFSPAPEQSGTFPTATFQHLVGHANVPESLSAAAGTVLRPSGFLPVLFFFFFQGGGVGVYQLLPPLFVYPPVHSQGCPRDGNGTSPQLVPQHLGPHSDPSQQQPFLQQQQQQRPPLDLGSFPSPFFGAAHVLDSGSSSAVTPMGQEEFSSWACSPNVNAATPSQASGPESPMLPSQGSVQYPHQMHLDPGSSRDGATEGHHSDILDSLFPGEPTPSGSAVDESLFTTHAGFQHAPSFQQPQHQPQLSQHQRPQGQQFSPPTAGAPGLLPVEFSLPGGSRSTLADETPSSSQFYTAALPSSRQGLPPPQPAFLEQSDPYAGSSYSSGGNFLPAQRHVGQSAYPPFGAVSLPASEFGGGVGGPSMLNPGLHSVFSPHSQQRQQPALYYTGNGSSSMSLLQPHPAQLSMHHRSHLSPLHAQAPFSGMPHHHRQDQSPASALSKQILDELAPRKDSPPPSPCSDIHASGTSSVSACFLSFHENRYPWKFSRSFCLWGNV